MGLATKICLGCWCTKLLGWKNASSKGQVQTGVARRNAKTGPEVVQLSCRLGQVITLWVLDVSDYQLVRMLVDEQERALSDQKVVGKQVV